LNRVNLMMIHY